MRWVNCLKTLNKLTMCLPGKTPSAPSDNVIRTIMNNHPVVLQIQREIVDEHKDVANTAAGEARQGAKGSGQTT
jgi:hypothetical protein